MAIFATLMVLVRFKERLLQMRCGRNPYAQTLRSVPIANFSDSATPTLGGMVFSRLVTYMLEFRRAKHQGGVVISAGLAASGYMDANSHSAAYFTLLCME